MGNNHSAFPHDPLEPTGSQQVAVASVPAIVNDSEKVTNSNLKFTFHNTSVHYV